MTYPRRVVVSLGEPRPPRPPRAVVVADGRARPDARVAVAPSGALVVTLPAVAPETTPTARGERVASAGRPENAPAAVSGPPRAIPASAPDRQEAP